MQSGSRLLPVLHSPLVQRLAVQHRPTLFPPSPLLPSLAPTGRQTALLRTATVRARPWRPSPDDVCRLSRGEAAKKRGTGSRAIPHRLSAEELKVFDAARKKGFLVTRGSGARSAALKGSGAHPLPNSFRQWCDARAAPCAVVMTDAGGGIGGVSSSGARDVVVVDLATLRRLETRDVEARCVELAAELGLRRMAPGERTPDDAPFDTQPLPMPQRQGEGQQHGDAGASSSGGGSDGDGDGGLSAAAAIRDLEQELAAADAAVAAQASLVRALKDGENRGNADADVQAGVQKLLKLKAHAAALKEALDDRRRQQEEEQQQQQAGQQAEGTQQQQGQDGDEGGEGDEASSSESTDGSGSSSGDGTKRRRREVLPEGHPFARAAIWQIEPLPLFFEGERAAAKEFARRAGALR